MKIVETDYLVVGAGAAGMAFVDTLIAQGDADVVMVDRRHAPGGHWHDAYPFVRLHQPSASYGVNSLALGDNALETGGSDAGLYERAGAAQICAYYQKVLNEVLLPCDHVRYFPMSDYLGDWRDNHHFKCRLTGIETRVQVRRKIVDTTYLEVAVPARHTPTFDVDPQVRFMPVGGLCDLDEAAAGYTILGGGKTAMDACYWLLENGIAPDSIRWIRPRDAWVLPRQYFQPLDQLAGTLESFALALETLAQASSLEALFAELEKLDLWRRFDPDVQPTMFRGAILSDAECKALKQIKNVVRLGRIQRLDAERIVLEQGEIPTDGSQLHIDCTASGFKSKPVRTIFEPGRITLQGLVGGFTCFSSATIAFTEANYGDDAQKNRLCVPTPTLNNPADWLHAYRGMIHTTVLNAADPAMAQWLDTTRLNITSGLSQRQNDPQIRKALTRTSEVVESALGNSSRLLSE